MPPVAVGAYSKALSHLFQWKRRSPSLGIKSNTTLIPLQRSSCLHYLSSDTTLLPILPFIRYNAPATYTTLIGYNAPAACTT
jgi:hypothetical protein